MHNQYPPTSYPSYTLSLNRPSLARRGVQALPVVALLLFIIGSVGFAQTPSSPATAATTQVVEIKDDRFTNTRTVTLSKLRITDDLLFSLKAEVKPSELHGIYRELEESPYVYVTFERSAANGHRYAHEDGQVNFLADGERVAGGPAHSDASADNRYHPGQEIVTGIIHLDALQRIARGRRVEMKLQETEITLDESVLKNLRLFVTAATR
jgi:hypothetical protein